MRCQLWIMSEGSVYCTSFNPEDVLESYEFFTYCEKNTRSSSSRVANFFMALQEPFLVKSALLTYVLSLAFP